MHERVAGLLRGLDGPIDDEVLDALHAALSSGALKSVTRDKRAATIARLSKGAEPARWICSRRGADQAAADLMPASAPRSGRYVFLVKQMLPEETDAPVVLEDEARGKVFSRRELTDYLLGLLQLIGHSPRAIRQALDALYAKDRRTR